QAPGKRVFNVAINGQSVLSNFDVYATAGYKTALQRQFTATANSSGQILISFTQGSADNPFINGIEIYQA
uniref:malectin domain-containing carbohydrate-binding protein n=1 Tax=Thermogemmatispora sp. TaxID=1968838 RepID=UPI0035E40173